MARAAHRHNAALRGSSLVRRTKRTGDESGTLRPELTFFIRSRERRSRSYGSAHGKAEEGSEAPLKASGDRDLTDSAHSDEQGRQSRCNDNGEQDLLFASQQCVFSLLGICNFFGSFWRVPQASQGGETAGLENRLKECIPREKERNK